MHPPAAAQAAPLSQDTSFSELQLDRWNLRRPIIFPLTLLLLPLFFVSPATRPESGLLLLFCAVSSPWLQRALPSQQWILVHTVLFVFVVQSWVRGSPLARRLLSDPAAAAYMAPLLAEPDAHQQLYTYYSQIFFSQALIMVMGIPLKSPVGVWFSLVTVEGALNLSLSADPARFVMVMSVVMYFLVHMHMEMAASSARQRALEARNRLLAVSLSPGDIDSQALKQVRDGAQQAVRKLFLTTFGEYDTVLSQVAELVVEAKRSLPGPALRNLVRGELKFDEFEIERKISSGGFCTVFRAKLRKSGRPCAVKSFSSADSLALPCLQGLVTEVITLTNLNHPHIIKVIGHCWAPQICMVLEYMPKGTLHDMLTYKALQLSWESPLLDVAQQMASAVAYLHSMRPPIVHRDIKTRNILMRDFRTCKLADFGLSVLSKADSRAGTVRYVAPEVAAYGESTVRSDVWSLGVCFWEMATRARFPGLRAAQRLPRRLPYSIPVAMRAVAFGCLSHDPATRLSAHDTEACLEEILRRIASLEYIPNEAPAAPAVAAAAAATDDDASSLAPYYQLDHSRLVVADLSQSQEVSQWYQDRLWNGEQLPAPPAPAPPPAVVASTLGRLMALDNHAREAERRASVPGIISPRFRGLQPHAAAATTVGGFAKLEAVPESPLNEAAESLSAPSTASPPPPATNPALSSSSSSQSSSIAPSSSVASVLTAAAADTFHPLPSTDSLVGPVAKAARPPLSSMLQRLAAADAMSRGETKLGTDQFLPVAAAAVAASTAAAAAAASTARSGLLQRLAAADAQSKAPPPAPAPAALPQIARAPQGLLQRLAAADAQSRGEQPPKPASEAPTSRDV